MLKSLSQLYKDRLEKGGAGSGKPAGYGGGGAKTGASKPKEKVAPKEKPTPTSSAKGKDTKDLYYVRMKEGNFGQNPMVKLLNQKVGRCEGIMRAYTDRAKKLSAGPKKEKLLKIANKLNAQAQVYASQRDSLLGRAAFERVLKQDELSEQQIMDMIDAGEFDDMILQDIADETGIPIEELRV